MKALFSTVLLLAFPVVAQENNSAPVDTAGDAALDGARDEASSQAVPLAATAVKGTTNKAPLLGPQQKAASRALLYSNGPLITSAGTGSGGADESQVQDVTLGMSTYGFGHQVVNSNRVADEFTVPAPGWCIDQITFYAYQTNSPTTSTITHVNVRIWNGIPGGGGSVIWGDQTTNRLVSSNWTGIYRTKQSTPTSTLRPIMANVTSIKTWLAPGTYWLDWQSNGTLTSGPWAPPITILGAVATGNGLQSLDGGVTYAAVNDTATGTPQGFPFEIDGIVSTGAGASSQVQRNGTPPNPSAFLPGVTTGPILGATWDPVIDHTTFATGAIADFVGVDVEYPPQNIPTQWGTLLIWPPPSSQLFFKPAGVPFSIAVPNDCTYIGRTVYSQGGSYSPGGVIEFANGLDLVIGTY